MNKMMVLTKGPVLIPSVCTCVAAAATVAIVVASLQDNEMSNNVC